MLIHVAENGQSYELDCGASTSVEDLQACLAKLVQVPTNEQLLISGDSRLEPQRTLGFYKLPEDGQRPVFLFNRTRLMADSIGPPAEEFKAIQIVQPPPPPKSRSSHPLDEALDPALKALPSYERQFRYHFQKGHAVFTASQAKYDACRRLLHEQQVQCMALDTARGSSEHYQRITTQVEEFLKDFNRQQKQHADLLTHFERDAGRLRAFRLHPKLFSKSRACLLDCCADSGNLRKSAEDCAICHKQFQSKVAVLKSMYQEFQHNLKELFHEAPSVDVNRVEETINSHMQFIEEATGIMQSLSKDVNMVKKLVDECTSNELSVSLRPHDAVSALGPMYEVHIKSHLPKMEICFNELGKLLDFCQAEKVRMNSWVHTSMRKVVALQSSFKDLRNQLSVFKEAMARQGDSFFELKKLRRIGPAYKACLAEVIRRKAGMKLYMGQAGQLAEKLAVKRDSEVARREEFLRLQSSYIPRDILGAMGLFGVPSQCSVNIAPFDNDLLDIDVKDLEVYAPESLVGSVLKNFGQGPVSSSVTGWEDNALLNSKGELSIESINEVSSEEIAGTSKLEVENAWLKSELASAVALLCNLDLEMDEDGETDESNPSSGRRNAAQKTVDALQTKDEYAEHLRNMLKTKQLQCVSYEKRIRELEQRLSDRFLEDQKVSSSVFNAEYGSSTEFGLPSEGTDKVLLNLEASGVTGEGRVAIRDISSVLEPMDGVSSSAIDDTRRDCKTGSDDQSCRFQEGADETMSELLGGMAAMDNPTEVSQVKAVVELVSGDAAMVESSCRDYQMEVPQVKVTVECSSETAYAEPPQLSSSSFNVMPDEKVYNLLKDNSTSSINRDALSSLQETLARRTKQLASAEEKLKSAFEDVAILRRDLEGNSQLLSECQMNCAHLENQLHQAREEAHINLCAAERRAAEYNALRSSSVKLRGLLERLRQCISVPVSGSGGFVDSLLAFAGSLRNESGDDGISEFHTFFRLLAERVGWLAQQRVELLERCSKAEAVQTKLARELENNKELLRNVQAKRKVEKQVSKGKLCFTRFEVHELAAFCPNSSGYYEAINSNSPHYFLSDETLSLFSSGPKCIVGQIVHMERKVVTPKPPLPPQPRSAELSGNSETHEISRPYGLPIGTEYFVVTLAIGPEYL